MSDQSNDINQILDSLGRLKDRVHELQDTGAATEVAGPDARMGSLNRDTLVLLRAGLAELDGLTQTSDFPNFFARFAGRTGLRMLLLKRWRSGLQVCAERNVSLPQEAKQKRSDGRAPIPTDEADLFSAVGRERQVYCGPVPIKSFPLDLTLLLGRGTSERRIVVTPLPARDRWSTYVYLDGDCEHDAALTVAEFLARHAVDRLRLLQKGDLNPEGEVAAMLKHELHRRRQSLERQTTEQGPSLGARDDEEEPSAAPQEPAPMPEVKLDWVHRQPSDSVEDDGHDRLGELDVPAAPSVPEPRAMELPSSALRVTQAQAEADAIVAAWEEAVLGVSPAEENTEKFEPVIPATPMAPEDILHQSGDLPAMPKAALHILSVIEDPRTTATRLERAVAMDQALTAKILRIANSPFYGAVRDIKTVSEAIVRLGYVTIRNWTLVTATKSVFLGAGAGLLFQKIWRQSVLSAMASQLVAQSIRRAEPEMVFVGGLMQNIGQLVLARSHPELFHQVVSVSAEEGLPYHVVEQELLGFDHGDLGALLIKEWNLSEDLEQGVRWHHRLDHPDIERPELAAMIALGEDIAACTGSGDESETAQRFDNSQAAEVLGISHDLFRRLSFEARDLSIDSNLFS